MKLANAPKDFAQQGLFVAVFGDGQPLTQDLEKQISTGVILDFGVMEFTDLAPNSLPNTGVLWKITSNKS